MEKYEELIEWAKQLSGFRCTPWNELPQIELYMDQLTGYLDKILSPVSPPYDGDVVTPSMVNNYVKGGHIERPSRKKYNREQVAKLYMLCVLKQNLSISDAAVLLEPDGDIEKLYESFVSLQNEYLEKSLEKLISRKGKNDGGLYDDGELKKFALSLTLKSCAERLCAERIIALIDSEKKAVEKAEREAKIKEKRAEKQAREAAKRAEAEKKNNDRK